MKQLNPAFVSNVLESPLSSFPSLDFVNPGIGNIIQPYGLFVPMHVHGSSHKKTKLKSLSNEENFSNQEGGGDTKEIPKDESSMKKEEEDKIRVVDQLNQSIKEKLSDDGIYESFLHPRAIKTGTIVLKRERKQSSEQAGKGEAKKIKKHSFNIVD